jgi:hypothetical protein
MFASDDASLDDAFPYDPSLTWGGPDTMMRYVRLGLQRHFRCGLCLGLLAKFGFSGWPAGKPGKPKFLRVAVVVTHFLYATHGRDTSFRDTSSKYGIFQGMEGPRDGTSKNFCLGTHQSGTDRHGIVGSYHW